MFQHDTLDGEDWIALIEVAYILKKFYDLNKRAESSKLNAERGVLADYISTLKLLLDYVCINTL